MCWLGAPLNCFHCYHQAPIKLNLACLVAKIPASQLYRPVAILNSSLSSQSSNKSGHVLFTYVSSSWFFLLSSFWSSFVPYPYFLKFPLISTVLLDIRTHILYLIKTTFGTFASLILLFVLLAYSQWWCLSPWILHLCVFLCFVLLYHELVFVVHLSVGL